MEKQALLGYLSHVMELNISQMVNNKVLSEIDRKIKGLGKPRRIEAPARQNVSDKPASAFMDKATLPPTAVAFFGSFIIYMLLPQKNGFRGGSGILDIFGFIAHILPRLLKGLGISLGIAIIVLIVSVIVAKRISARRTKIAANAVEKTYEQEVKRYRSAIAADKTRVEKERQSIQALCHIRESLVMRRKNCEQAMDTVYSLGWLYPKYRNFHAASKIFEYIESGRCDCLDGADGAYNIYENEVRLDRIVDKLDVIIDRLDMIISNQYEINRNIRSLNDKHELMIDCVGRIANGVDVIADGVNSIAKSNAVIEYNTERTAREIEMATWVNGYRFT